MTLYDAAHSALADWIPFDAEQSTLRAAYLSHLDVYPDGLTRDCHPDHVTASTLVVNESRTAVLLNLHRRYNIWVQFGGHLEEQDGSLDAAALREAVEESGIENLKLIPGIAQLSTHEVRCGPIRPSHHLDVRFVAVAPDGSQGEVSDESLEVRWFATAEQPRGLDASLQALIRLGLG